MTCNATHTQISSWGASNAFGADPFASQGTSSDPFSSGDPFGDDPFTRQTTTPSDNPFTTPTRQEIPIPDALPKVIDICIVQ